jgi:uncharacterized protein
LTSENTIAIVKVLIKEYFMRYLFLIAFASITTACSSSPIKSWVEINGKRFNVEVMTTNDGRNRGLMFRDSMPETDGMLFVHENAAPRAYWMKNTKIPLDIIFFSTDKKLVSAQERVPACTAGDQCPPFRSEGDAQFVLELNAGSMEKYQFKKGDTLKTADDIPNVGSP